MFRGIPAAVPERSPKLERMSWRTTPLSTRTLGPLEPSPGNGPPVSWGTASTGSPPPVVVDAAPVVEVELDVVAPVLPLSELQATSTTPAPAPARSLSA